MTTEVSQCILDLVLSDMYHIVVNYRISIIDTCFQALMVLVWELNSSIRYIYDTEIVDFTCLFYQKLLYCAPRLSPSAA